MAELVVQSVSASYGQVTAVQDVSLRVADGACAALLGANGAGKTTLMRAISCLISHHGQVLMGGVEVKGTPEEVARSGLAHVLEGRQIFTTLTVRENLIVARSSDRRASDDRLAFLLDAFPILKSKIDSYGGQLSGGQQQLLAIARSLMTGPKVVLMDEPSLGLSPVAVEQLADAIHVLRKQLGTTLFVAEQSIALALEIASEFHVLQRGSIVYSGAGDFDVIWGAVHRAYLGGPAETKFRGSDGRG